jgi:hypothetical protein
MGVLKYNSRHHKLWFICYCRYTAASSVCPVPVPDLEKPPLVEKRSSVEKHGNVSAAAVEKQPSVASMGNPPPAVVLKKPLAAAEENELVAAAVEMVHVASAVQKAPPVAAGENPTDAATVDNKAHAAPDVENPVVAVVPKKPSTATVVDPPENPGKASDVGNLPTAAVLKIPLVASMCFLYIFCEHFVSSF